MDDNVTPLPQIRVERDAYNDGYTHEAMHAAHIACDMWDSHVFSTRCAEEFSDVKEAIEKAADAMYNVYQLIGQKFKDGDDGAPGYTQYTNFRP